MKFFFVLFLIAILVFVGLQAYRLNDQRVDLNNRLSELKIEEEELAKENQELNQDLEYFADDVNLAKELRSRFNYKEPGEKLFILVPGE